MPDLSTLAGRLLDVELGSEDSTVLFTTARRNGAINDGIREFADLTECWTKNLTWTASAQMFWDLLSTTVGSTDFVRLASERGVTFRIFSSAASTQVTILSGEDFPQQSLRFLDIYYPNWAAQVSIPSTTYQVPFLYTLANEYQLGFYPRPSTAGSSAVFEASITYVAYPPTLTSSTDVPFTFAGVAHQNLRPYHQGIVHYATAQLEKLRKNTTAVQAQMQAFLSYVQRYVANTRPRGGRTIQTSRRYLTERQRRVEMDPRR